MSDATYMTLLHSGKLTQSASTYAASYEALHPPGTESIKIKFVAAHDNLGQDSDIRKGLMHLL